MDMEAPNLGDAGLPNDDGSYTGAPSSSAFSMDYYRAKYTEFQQVLSAMDLAYNAGVDLWAINQDEALAVQLDEYEARRGMVKATAEALNLAAQAINAAGGRMPVLSLPGSLGALPALLVPAGVLAAVASIIVWGRSFIAGLVQYMQDAQALAAQDTPEKKAALAAALATARQAQQNAETPLSSAASIVKWAAIAAAAFFAWKAFADHRDKNPALAFDDDGEDEAADD